MEKEDHGIIRGRTFVGLGLLAMFVALFALLGTFDLDGYFTRSVPAPAQKEPPVMVPDEPWQENEVPPLEPSPTAVAEQGTPVSLSDIVADENEEPGI